MLKFPCDPACESRRKSLYIVYGFILVGCVILAFCHFMVVYMKRRRIRMSNRDYQQRRESFAALVASSSSINGPFPQPQEFQSVKDAFLITTDGATEMAIELPEDYPFPLLRNGVLENGGRGSRGSIVSFTDHRNRPLAMQQRFVQQRSTPNHAPGHGRGHGVGVGENILEEDEEEERDHDGTSLNQVLSQRNMKTNIVTVDVHNNRRDSGQSLENRDGNFMAGPRSLGVATVSQSYHSMHAISVPVPVGGGGSDHSGSGSLPLDRISRPQSALSAYDISDIVSSSPEVGRKSAKKSPKTC